MPTQDFHPSDSAGKVTVNDAAYSFLLFVLRRFDSRDIPPPLLHWGVLSVGIYFSFVRSIDRECFFFPPRIQFLAPREAAPPSASAAHRWQYVTAAAFMLRDSRVSSCYIDTAGCCCVRTCMRVRACARVYVFQLSRIEVLVSYSILVVRFHSNDDLAIASRAYLQIRDRALNSVLVGW